MVELVVYQGKDQRLRTWTGYAIPARVRVDLRARNLAGLSGTPGDW